MLPPEDYLTLVIKTDYPDKDSLNSGHEFIEITRDFGPRFSPPIPQVGDTVRIDYSELEDEQVNRGDGLLYVDFQVISIMYHYAVDHSFGNNEPYIEITVQRR